jgi:hypothetical protein
MRHRFVQCRTSLRTSRPSLPRAKRDSSPILPRTAPVFTRFCAPSSGGTGTGLRQGELLGLRWRDVDFSARKLRVVRPYVRGEWRWSRRATATRFSACLKRRVSFERSRGRPAGSLVLPERRRSRLLPPRDRAGVREITFHELRHTFGTRMAADHTTRRPKRSTGPSADGGAGSIPSLRRDSHRAGRDPRRRSGLRGRHGVDRRARRRTRSDRAGAIEIGLARLACPRQRGRRAADTIALRASAGRAALTAPQRLRLEPVRAEHLRDEER